VRLYPPPASGHELKLVFDQQSWVQVIIDNQETRHGMYSAGMSETWTAEESILLRVGNAGGVTVIFDGRDLGRLGPEGRVAKIELPRNP
jgi:cytoskeleton protein RodZ